LKKVDKMQYYHGISRICCGSNYTKTETFPTDGLGKIVTFPKDFSGGQGSI